MAAIVPLIQVSANSLHATLHVNKKFKATFVDPSCPSTSVSKLNFSKIQEGNCRSCAVIRCSYNSNGNGRRQPSSGGGYVDDGVKSVEKLLEEKRRAELSARIASWEFTVEKAGFPSIFKNSLWKLVVPKEFLDFLFEKIGAGEDYPRIPEAKGSINAIRNPSIAKHILKDNSKAYSKGILSEILDFVWGRGLYLLMMRHCPSGDVLQCQQYIRMYVAAMIGLFGQATERLCRKLDEAASNGDSLFSPG